MIWYLTYPTYHDITWPMMTYPQGDLIGRATTDGDDPSGLLLSFLSCPVKICQDQGHAPTFVAYLLGGFSMF